ncbi:hypothetical protein C100_17675 [Sphingobium sp. C100]|jgi:acetate kinase|nr:hypothetical protein C100_17675 [Sphingobium sp. C100]
MIISTPESRVKLMIIPTDEERMIAFHCLTVLREMRRMTG